MANRELEKLSDELLTWEQVDQARRWPALLVGNGASRAVWSRFEYRSLYETACGFESDGLNAADRELFRRLNTHNFESVLGALWMTQTVNDILELPSEIAWVRYTSIRRALANALRAVHIPWLTVQPEALAVIREALLTYEWIFSTNYDLLLYWAIMSALSDPPDVRDFFWRHLHDYRDSPGLCFEPWNVGVPSEVTKILYLHGGLHLYELSAFQAVKRVAGDENLLDAFYRIAEKETSAIPLFVAEGNADEKRSVIGTSPYLSFAYHQLVLYGEPLVVFGHGLGPSDQHIIDAIARWRNRELAISIKPLGADHILAEKARYMQMFPGAGIAFFDATTHPLGSPDVNLSAAAV